MITFYKYKVHKNTLSKAEKEIFGNSLFVYSRLSPQELGNIALIDGETENGKIITLLVEQLNISNGKLIQINPDNP